MAALFELVEAHVDWITVTAGTGEGGPRLLDYGGALLASEREKGNFGRATNFEGYHGTQSTHLFVGWRLDGTCIRLGGGLARARWRDVVEQATNVTRLDLAVTVKRTPPDDDLARTYWNSLPAARTGAGRPTDYTLLQSRLGGQTLYCGSRASERFGRIYDKYRESKGHYPEGSWRFEIEYKGQAAKEVSAYLRGFADLGARIAGIVERRFFEWGIITPWSDVKYSWCETYIPPKTDNESRMKWLREQVRLSIEKMATGYTADEIRLALGLQFGTAEATAVYETLMEQRTANGATYVPGKNKPRLPKGKADDRNRTEPDDGNPSAGGNPVPRGPKPTGSPPRAAHAGNQADVESAVPITVIDANGNPVDLIAVSDG